VYWKAYLHIWIYERYILVLCSIPFLLLVIFDSGYLFSGCYGADGIVASAGYRFLYKFLDAHFIPSFYKTLARILFLRWRREIIIGTGVMCFVV
jgi:hypothetical protein